MSAKVSIDQAHTLLTNGDVVAIPTETVYGLAGWIYSEAGLKKIFSTKERPFFDPLIVHIASIDEAKKLTSNWTPIHDLLARAFWPGPLTLIASKNENIHPLITAGLSDVALRCPAHPDTLELLKRIEGGLAAPSANKFGKTSPTTAQHVMDEFQDLVPVIDGGSCDVGIESTVVDVKNDKVSIYRPGKITAKDIQDVLTLKGINLPVEFTQSPVAPGQLKHHYMPSIPLITFFDLNQDSAILQAQEKLNLIFKNPKIYSIQDDSQLESRFFYEHLRTFSQEHDAIFIRFNIAWISEDHWQGLWNRMSKASSLILS